MANRESGRMKTSWKFALFAALTFPIAGILEGIYPRLQEVMFVPQSLIIGIALYIWCGVHAVENGYAPNTRFKILCFLFALVGVPLYLFKTFGFKSGGKKVLIALSMLAVAGITYELTYEITYQLVQGS